MTGDSYRMPLTEAVQKAPTAPGVYLFENDRGEPLYIGKAADLRTRIRQYLSGHDTRPLVPHLLREATVVRVIVTGDEREALILENHLIKRHQPPFNLELKDDKSYPYLALTDEPFPALVILRRPRGRFRLLRGPFTSAKQLRRFRQALLSIYPLRRCRTMPKRACFNYQLGLCPAPCEGRITATAYAERIEQIAALLEGREWEAFKIHLSAEIQRAAAELRFEKAAELRDTLVLLPDLERCLGITSATNETLDAFYFSFTDEHLLATVGRYEEGTLLDLFHLNRRVSDDPQDEIVRLIVSFYEHLPPPRAIAIFPERQTDKVPLRDILGTEVRLVAMAPAIRTFLAKNHLTARERLLTAASRYDAAIEELANIAGTDIESILCLDVSTLQGKHSRAGAVWWESGRFVTKNYRRFTIKSLSGQNDPASLAETVARLCAHWEDGEWPVPDLLLVDGGIMQLNAVLPVVGERVALLGIVKDRRGERGFEKLVTPDGAEIPLGNDLLGLLLKRIRDEAHRFAITTHRTARKKDFSSLLGDLPGIGPKREKALIVHFGTVAAVQSATCDDLAAAPGMTRRAAEALWRHLHGGGVQKG